MQSSTKSFRGRILVLKLEFCISSARTPVASPRSDISINEIILAESEKLEVSESSEELVALPKSKAILEHVTRGLSKPPAQNIELKIF